MAIKMASNMGNWKSKILRKHNKGSQTPGHKKNAQRCQASPLDKWMAKASRSYKHPQYHDWCVKKNG